MSKAEEFLDQALGGNHYVATLTFFALKELLNDYGKDLQSENAELKEVKIKLWEALHQVGMQHSQVVLDHPEVHDAILPAHRIIKEAMRFAKGSE